ncbi:FAST kinase domain-containing protein 3, mitochondrial [Suricata suricatta]|uniref:FAST kinase domains 3 n=1 Tax=Suricata suricatta TaxID=37032 RepID=A0A673T916_SURSU|nr:FAST kinase domain-containing protein 3, mitochondrial [Suricata suricatta]XP_029797453.1 FAST kinase domain-containing protein 3, mitochondrial [Suricata suricatta]XP_029797454.1 FAST kinase domain-containing protein 3, mitochondrial [Suricata suricatta]
MALITLRRNLCHLADFRTQGALAALKSRPGNPFHEVGKERSCPWLPSLQPEPFRVRIHHACCQKFHSENGNALHPLGEPVLSRAHDWHGPEQNPKGLDEPMFYRRLKDSASSEEVLHFLSTLQTWPDTVAAGALQRIWEVEKKDGDQKLPKETLENGVFRALCVRLEQDSSKLSEPALVTALQALSLLNVDPQSSLLRNLVAESQHRVKRGGLQVHSLCVLGESLIRLQGPGCETLELIMCQLQEEELETLAPEDIVALYRILQARSEKLDRHQAFLNKINHFSLSVVSGLSPTLMSEMLTALMALDQTQALPLVIKLGKYAVRHIPRFTQEELAKVLEAFIYFGHNDRFFTAALEQHVASLCLTLDPEVVSRAVEYCSKKRILSKPIFDAVAETFVGHADKFSPHQVSELIETFGKLNYLPPNASALFRKLENLLLTHLDYFPPKTLLKILHSCSLIECHPVNFMAKIFSPHFLQQLQGEESYVDRLSLAQLTQLFLTSVLECPFYKGRKLLPKYQVRSFLTPCCSLETPLDFQLYRSVRIGLIDLLGARMYFASKVLTPYCYTLDVEIKLDEEGLVLPFTIDEDVHKRLALCLDDPKRFSLNSKHLLGKEAIKHRHLRLLGYQVVQIPYYEVEMLKSRVELVEYLQRKLFPHNVGVRW